MGTVFNRAACFNITHCVSYMVLWISTDGCGMVRGRETQKLFCQAYHCQRGKSLVTEPWDDVREGIGVSRMVAR